MIITLCNMVGIKAWQRDASLDGSSTGNEHINVIAECDGKYYQADAGLAGKRPRAFDIHERKNLFIYGRTDDGNGIYLRRYDGNPEEKQLLIPNTIEGLPVTEIKEEFSTFHNKITSLIIPDTVKSLDKYSLYGFEKLEETDLPSALEELSEGAFFKCTTLKSISIPDGVKIIGKKAFKDCLSLHSIKLPDGLEKIEKMPLRAAKSLKKLKYLRV